MARSLREFLELTEPQAAEQWARILRRRKPPPGGRQEPFLPVEILLSYGLFQVLDPHRFGGANIDAVPEEVKRLSATWRRSAGSITSKMLNLDGSRKNCGRFEVDLWLCLTDSPGLFPLLYGRILRAARATGLDAGDVPDFLDWLEDANPDLLGQDELGPRELLLAREEGLPVTAHLRRIHGFSEEETDRLVLQRVRLGQHRFARSVLRHYDHRCGFCGFSPGDLRARRLLLASHVKPWRDSTSRERLDPRNGICACPNHDAAFDGGLLTVNGGLRIHRAAPLANLLVREPQANRIYGEGGLSPRLILPPNASGPDPRYLAHHREHVFRAG